MSYLLLPALFALGFSFARIFPSTSGNSKQLQRGKKGASRPTTTHQVQAGQDSTSRTQHSRAAQRLTSQPWHVGPRRALTAPLQKLRAALTAASQHADVSLARWMENWRWRKAPQYHTTPLLLLILLRFRFIRTVCLRLPLFPPTL